MSTKNNTTLACQCLSMSKQIFRVFNNTKPCRELLISLLMFTSLLNISSSWVENAIQKKNKTTKKRWVSTNTCLFLGGGESSLGNIRFFFRGKFPETDDFLHRLRRSETGLTLHEVTSTTPGHIPKTSYIWSGMGPAPMHGRKKQMGFLWGCGPLLIGVMGSYGPLLIIVCFWAHLVCTLVSRGFLLYSKFVDLFVRRLGKVKSFHQMVVKHGDLLWLNP